MNFKILLSTSFIVTSLSALAQDAGNTFAITGDGSGDYRWMNIRKVDIATGKVTQEIYQSNKTAFVLLDAASKKELSANAQQLPTTSMVAAAAYDKKHDKLFFTPMRIGELRWIDLSAKGDAPKFYTEQTQLLNSLDLKDEANHITRMDIAADGNGYAISNDGNHLIRFTTGKRTVITDLGNLIDAESNKGGISIHNKCTSWGGDMVADAYGKLYIISANHQIFKVDIDTRITTHIGTITGLPANYTTNGAAVDDNENIVVSSANTFEGYYRFSLKDLAATKIENSDTKYNASDLANGNLLFQKEADAKRSFGLAPLPQVVASTDARIYPNPVTTGEFKVLFDGLQAGQYTVAISDLSGKALQATKVIVSSKLQAQTVKIGTTLAKGMYLVKVTDATNKMIFTDRIMVQ